MISAADAASRLPLRACAAARRRRAARGGRLIPRAGLLDVLPSLPALGGGLRERPLDASRVALGPFTTAPMGIGSWAWGNKLVWGYDEAMDAELQAAFNLAVAGGVGLFDTADSYGTGRLEGRSETLLGRFTAQYPGSARTRAGVRVATKLAAYPWRVAPSQWVAAARASAARAAPAGGRLALVQLHWSAANYAPLQERLMWDGLAAIYAAGLCDAVGVSNYGARQLRRVHAHLAARGVPLASAQVQYSLVSRGPEQEAVREACRELGVAMIAYSPLGLGLLTGRYDGGGGAAREPTPRGPRSLIFNRVLPGAGALLAALRAVAAARRKSPSQVAINWCICKGTVPIPGVKSLAQCRDNLGALGWRLSAGEVAALDAAADALPARNRAIQNIFQTK